MKQKTAMQELKELVASSISSDELGWWLFENMDRLVEKEKSQIMDAFDMACQDQDRIGKEYYNETYKQD